MKCPKCNQEMETGCMNYMTAHGRPYWAENNLKRTTLETLRGKGDIRGNEKIFSQASLNGYLCRRCEIMILENVRIFE